MPSYNTRGPEEGRSFLQAQMDLFSRTFNGVFGRRDLFDPKLLDDLEQREASPPAKIQPVVPTLYPVPPPPPPPKPLAPAMHFDARSKALLLALGASGGANAELADALVACEEEPMTELALARNRGVVQRVTLVARLIEAIESDPHVPDGFKHAVDRLRFPLIKSVLGDPSFLAHRGHPLRTIASRLALQATTATQWDVSTEREFVTALDNAVRDYDLSAGFVRPLVNRLRPLPIEVIKQFVEQLQRERTERELIVQSRQRVDEEIALRLRGVVLEPRLRMVIDAWKPVLVRRLARFGSDSADWRGGLAVVEHLLRFASGADVTDTLRQQLEAGMIEVGQSADPLIETLVSLRRREPASVVVDLNPAVRYSPLARLMQGNRWFRVFDHTQQVMRWMRTHVYDASTQTVVFTEIDGGSPLLMHAQQFLEDLKRGLSAPNQPDEETTQIMSDLRAAA